MRGEIENLKSNLEMKNSKIEILREKQVEGQLSIH